MHHDTILWYGSSKRIALGGWRVQVKLCAQKHLGPDERLSLKHLPLARLMLCCSGRSKMGRKAFYFTEG